MDRDPPLETVYPNGAGIERQPAYRQDFPIDMARDNYVARRDFAKFLMLTSGAFFTGQLWIGWQSERRKRLPPPPRVEVAVLDEIPLGAIVPFHYPTPEDPCVLIRKADGTLRAFDRKCTHLACPVLPDLEAGKLLCPCHHGEFDLDTGRPLAGPPRRPLPLIRLEVTDGLVIATGVELRTT